MKPTSLIFILIMLFGCTHTSPPSSSSHQEKENVDTDEWIPLNYTNPIENVIPLVLDGNINAYKELHIAYLDSIPCLLPYARLMADKYDYDIAYYDVYMCLTFRKGTPDESARLDSLDEQTRKMALDYLKKGAEKGEHNSLSTLKRLATKNASKSK